MLIASDSDSTCIDTSQSIITVNANPIIDSITSVNISCNGLCDGSATVYTSGGVLPLTYIWSNAFIGNPITNMCVGNYCVTITDANGCQDTACVAIIEPSPFEQTVSAFGASCFGNCDGFANVSFSGGTCPYSYWFDILTLGTLNCPPNSYSAPFLCAGTYIGIAVDFNGCTDTDTVVISQPLLLDISLSATSPTCNGYCDGSILATVLGGNAPYTYIWSTGQTTNPITNLCGGGTYCVTVTDQNGCQDTACVTLVEPPGLSSSVVTTPVTCPGAADGTATVTISGGTPPYTYMWDLCACDVGPCGPAVTGLAIGTCCLVVADQNNCTINVCVVITGPPPISIAPSIVSSTCGLANGAACVNVIGACTPYTIVWDDPDTTSGACVFNLFAGVYNVMITDCNGCTTTTPIVITNVPGPTIDSVSTSAVTCSGDSNGVATAFATGSSSPLTYIWLFGSDTIASGAGVSTVFSLWEGSFAVNVIDANGCVATMPFSINEPDTLTLAVTNQINVSCNSICDGSASAVAGGGIPPYSFLWSNGCGTASCDSLCDGTYNVTLTDVNGCSTSASVTITEPDSLVITDSVVDVSCYGGADGAIYLNVTGGTPFYSYVWNPLISPPSNLTAQTYCVTVTDINGCTNSSCIVVNEPPALSMSVLADDTVVCIGTSTQISAQATGGTSPYTYSWNTGNTSSSFTAAPSSDTTFSVTVTDANGCSTNGAINITSDNCVSVAELNGNQIPVSIYPNPNSGEFFLEFENAQLKALEVQIIDIQGKTVFRKRLNPNRGVKHHLNIGVLARGIYTIHVISSEGRSTLQLVIEQ